MLKIAGCTLLLSVLCCAPVWTQQLTGADKLRLENAFADHEFIAKGGIGIIVGGALSIDLKSAKNELRLSEGNKWTGKDAPASELVIFFQKKAWLPQALPQDFNISQAIIVSFEAEKVRFFDFGKMEGGFYRRQRLRQG